jgi:hypothetical protein
MLSLASCLLWKRKRLSPCHSLARHANLAARTNLLLSVLILLPTSARHVPLGAAHSGRKKHWSLDRACEEGRLVGIDFLCFSLRPESISMLVKQYGKINVQGHKLFRQMADMSGNLWCWFFYP